MSESHMPDEFDRLLGALHDLPDVVEVVNTTHTVEPLVGNAKTFIVRTIRQTGIGDTIFLHVVGKDLNVRLTLPAKVSDLIARQRDVLTTKGKRKQGRRIAAERKAAGIQPAFLVKKKRGA